MTIDFARLRDEWFGNVRADLLAGLVVALALIPEALSFCIIAGVDPKVGLYASFSMAVVISIAGGRTAMISAATGAMSLVFASLVREHGLQYLLACTILTGIFQILIGYFRLASFMRFVSRSVMTGFVNALAILIFITQVKQLRGATWEVYPVIAGALAIIYLLPRLTTAIPSPLIAIAVMTAISVALGLDVKRVGDMGQLPDSLPTFILPDVPIDLETIRIILPYALALSVVGLMESLMTAALIDDITDTASNKNRECAGQGIANIVTALLGGMAGCAMIGQSMVNVRSGGRGRLSTFTAGAVLLILVVVLGDWVARIPMGALMAVMVMTSIATFDWGSIRRLRVHPKTSSFVMIAVVIAVVATNNLAIGVGIGVLLSGIFFAWKVSQLVTIASTASADGRHRTYTVSGQIFFATADALANGFDYRDEAERVRIDLTHAHLWDISAIAALDKAIAKFGREGVTVEVTGMNDASASFARQVAVRPLVDDLDLDLSSGR